MAKKKTFNLQNPALQFISTQTNPTEQNALHKAPEGIIYGNEHNETAP